MLLITTVFAFALPIGAMIYWRKRTELGIKPFVVGAACFLLFAMSLEQVLHTFVLGGDTPLSRTIKGTPALFVLYGSLAAGIFEETGRLFGFKALLRGERRKEVSVAYGIGHGGIEVILVLGVSYLMLTLVKFGVSLGDAETNALLADSLSKTSTGTMVWAILERVSGMMLHIGLSIMVFYAASRPGKMIFYLIAILLHALADVPAALFQAEILKSIPAIELIVFCCSVCILSIGVFIYRKMDKGAES